MLTADRLRAEGLLSFGDVEARLVEAMWTCWRQPDRERGWLSLRSHWPEISREWWEYDARGGDGTSSEVRLRPPALTRRDMAEMEEAFGWLVVTSPVERKAIAMAVAAMARDSGRIAWIALAGRDHADPALRGSADRLRMIYARGMAKVVRRANATR